MTRQFRTQNRNYKYLGRKADGTVCCAGDDPSTMCDECRTRAAADGTVPAARRLSDALNKTGGTPAPGKSNLHGVPKPRRLSDALNKNYEHPTDGTPNMHGVPRPQSLAKAIQAKGGRR
jgi:hypothetical protein